MSTDRSDRRNEPADSGRQECIVGVRSNLIASFNLAIFALLGIGRV